MAKIPKESLKPSEVTMLLEKGLIFNKNKDNYGVRDKDLDRVLNEIKTSSITEGVQSPEDINNRAYSLRVTTLILNMIKSASTLQEYASILASINSLFPIDPDSAIRLLTLLKSTMKV